VIACGQAICAIVATSVDQAKRGAAMVKVEYEDLEKILTLEVVTFS